MIWTKTASRTSLGWHASDMMLQMAKDCMLWQTLLVPKFDNIMSTIVTLSLPMQNLAFSRAPGNYLRTPPDVLADIIKNQLLQAQAESAERAENCK